MLCFNSYYFSYVAQDSKINNDLVVYILVKVSK